MSNDYARATGQPRTIELDGTTYKVSRLKPSILGEIDAWLKEVVPNPKAEARQYMDGMSDEVAKHIWSTAVEEAKDWPPSLMNARGEELVMTQFEGQARLLYALLRRGAADFTLEKARELADRLEIDDFNRLLELSLPGEIGDPKALTTATDAPSPTPNSAPNSP